MKKYMSFIFTLMIISPSLAQTPNANELLRQKKTQIRYLVQQIAALKAYGKVLRKGYDIAQKGLTLIEDIRNNTYTMDEKYLLSLKQVNPVIANSKKVKNMITLATCISNTLQTLSHESHHNENFTDTERSYLDRVCNNLVQETQAALDELSLIITDNAAEMKDNERIRRIDLLYDDIIGKHAFTQSFTGSTRQLALQRANEKHQIAITQTRTTPTL